MKYLLSPTFLQISKSDSVLIASENRSVEVKKQFADKLLPLLDGSLTEDEIVDELSSDFSMAETYYTLNKLKEANAILLISGKDATPSEIFNAQLGVNSEQSKLIVVNLCRELSDCAKLFYDLISWSAEKEFIELENESLLEGGQENTIYLTLTPSYQDPKLLEFNKLMRGSKRKWLPIKVSGTQFYAGPLFIADQRGCAECVATQNRMHQTFLHPSSIYSQSAIMLFAALTTQELQRVCAGVANRLEHGIIEYDFEKLAIVEHCFMPISRCRVCGESHNKLNDSKPNFATRPKIGYIDGGDRIISAKESIKRFLPLVSPLTGAVGRLISDEKWSDSKGGYWLAHTRWGICDKVDDTKAENDESDHRHGRVSVTGTSAGKGRSEEQAQMSAIGEALERYSSQYFGYEEVINASYEELGDRAINPWRLASFSEAQFANREAYKDLHFGRVPHPYPPSEKIDWVKCYSLSKERDYYMPASYAFYGYPQERGGRFIYGCSNGVSGGNCIEEAFLQGVYELIERDGTALWWYNQLKRPALDLELFADKKMRHLIETIRSQGHSIVALDFTPQRPGIPVIGVVVIPTDENHNPCFGLGAHLDVRIALDRAMSEIVQGTGMMSISKYTAPENDWWKKLCDENRTDFLTPCSAPLKRPEDYTCQSTDTLLGDIEVVLNILKECGMDCYMHELSRPETEFSVCRVIVPDLLHFWPRHGNKRVYDAPVEFGWLEKPLTEEELNPYCFPF